MIPPAPADSTAAPEPGHHGAPGAARGRPAATTPATARHHVTELLRAAGASLDSVTAADALLVTSELVTNAMRHGGGITRFHAALIGDTLHLTVSDASPHHPALRPAARGRVGGFGWPLIQRLTDHVGITSLPGGGKSITTIQGLT
ncbi:ATP-binding protein [Streptomyces sp. NPDC058701]|uniref:ATP-binding protein n=1 Tax=Streptomyces sp. NPDC058701 TaxID=3346608 RepID=UPI00364D77F0